MRKARYSIKAKGKVISKCVIVGLTNKAHAMRLLPYVVEQMGWFNQKVFIKYTSTTKAKVITDI